MTCSFSTACVLLQANLWHCVAQVEGEYWVVTPSMYANEPDMWFLDEPSGPFPSYQDCQVTFSPMSLQSHCATS